MVSLSNIGDVVLTFPVLDVLHTRFPLARISVIVGPKAAGLLAHIPWVDVVPYDKKMSWQAKGRWLLSIRQKHFDLMVDLRNSMLPFLLDATTVTCPSFSRSRVHMRQKHLERLRGILDDASCVIAERPCLFLTPQQGKAVDRLLHGLKDYAVVAPGAADQRKRWPEECFLKVVLHLRRRNKVVVLLGDQQDALAGSRIAARAGEGVMDLCGKTRLQELLPVISRASLAVTNDSGIMHLASYADKPVIALFGPTDPSFYGPWSTRSVALKRDADMASIPVEDVLSEVDRLL